MFVGTKTISIFLCKERHGLCFGLTAIKYTSIVIQKLNRILNIRYNKKKAIKLWWVTNMKAKYFNMKNQNQNTERE